MSQPKWKRWLKLGVGSVGLMSVGLLALFIYVRLAVMPRFARIGTWMENPAAQPEWKIEGGTRCGPAPMLIPSGGFVGVGWRDGLWPLYQHSGYDIFSPDPADNVTPIYAAYDGYLTREADWRSAVIIRHPDFHTLYPALTGGDPIWTFYTHMASRDGADSFISPEFPPGTREKWVNAGTLLGYQGSWSGNPERDMSRHLHFSIVRANPDGSYGNETDSSQTLDPTPFLGLSRNEAGILGCW